MIFGSIELRLKLGMFFLGYQTLSKLRRANQQSTYTPSVRGPCILIFIISAPKKGPRVSGTPILGNLGNPSFHL